jgi:MYXO-CTERM domain-containing protein
MIRRSPRPFLLVTLLLAACGQSGQPGPDAATGARTGTGPASAALAAAAPDAIATARPANFNIMSQSKAVTGAAMASAAVPRGNPRSPVHMDAKLGVPSFMWAQPGAAPGAVAARTTAPASAVAVAKGPVEAARAHLGGAAAAYGLVAADVAKAVVTKVHDTGRGPIIVTFRQYPGGLEVFREEASVAMSRDLSLVAISGSVSPASAASSARATPAFALDAPAALAAALGDLTGEAFTPADFARAGQKGKFATYDLLPAVAAARAERFLRVAGVKQVWFRLPSGLRAAWQVEVDFQKLGSPETLAYGSVISATDGALLFRKDHQESEAYAYRVWASDPVSRLPDDGPQGLGGTPHPTATTDGYQAPFVAQTLVTLENLPSFSRAATDPWLDPAATETFGNNVWAYADVDGVSGPSAGDVFGEPSAPGQFDYLYDLGAPPQAPASQVQAAIVQLFYDNNAFHDWYYDVGFDEAAGNAQLSNYGRAGVEGDPILAEAQDYSGTNNANMSTPPDGFAPRMQMYLWNNSDLVRTLVNGPAGVAGYKRAQAAQFGLQAYELTGDLVPALPADGCTALTNGAAVSGKIALIDRGTCNFVIKVKAAQVAGAAGVLVRNVASAQAFSVMGGTDATITIPSLLVSLTDGQAIGAAITAGDVVNVTLQRTLGLMRDGTIDNLIVAHEWGHYISNRLVQDSVGLDTTQARGMGEGFGDFHSLLLEVREEDTAVPSNATWNGVYSTAGFVGGGLDTFAVPNNAYYYGIRRTPYSTDMTRAPFTFKHVANASALPAVTPPLIPNGSVNSEVHNAGEVWATVLWECYAALLRDTQGATPRLSFAEANLRMRTYLVAGYKLMPQSPTFLEGRDALLAAALAGDRADFDAFWSAFAKRGFGVGAVAPLRFTTSNNGLVESFTLGGDMAFVKAGFSQGSSGCDDADGVLDNGETGTLTVTLRNIGGSALQATVATIASSDANLTFPDGPGLKVGPSSASGTATATVRVTLTGAAYREAAPLTITFPDGYLAAPTSVDFDLVTNYDILKQASTTDSFEGPLAWTASADTQLWHAAGFIRDLGMSGASTDHALFGPDADAPSDLRITSPLLVVGAGPLVLSWDHAFGFEADAGGNYDGGVVELSADGGTTWVDIGGPLYNGTILAYPGNHNPLQDAITGRAAFVDFSPAFAASGDTDHVSLDLGTTYAGKTVQVRFRIGSDNNTYIWGWLIDNFSAAGIVNTPFDLLTADARRCVNRPPVASAGAAQSVTEGAAVTLDGTASSDPDAGTTLAYAWTQIAGPVVTLSGASTASASFTAPAVPSDSSLVFALTVSDGAASSSATTVVTVHHVNRSPVASAGADQSAAEGAAVTLDATGSFDPDSGTTLCYAWTQTGGPTVVLTGAGEVLARFTAPAVDADTDLTFQVSVCDGTAYAADTTVVRVLNINRPPVASAGAAQSVAEGAAVTLDGTASSDPDAGTTLAYAWTQVAGPVVTLSGASAASASFTAPAVLSDASLVFQLTVSDGAASSSATTVVNVSNVNHPPVASAGLDQAVGAGALVTLDASGSTDPDAGSALSYTWTQTAGPAVTLTGTSLVKPSFIAPDVTATFTFLVTVSDGVAQSTDTVDVVTTATPPKSSSGCGCSSNGSNPAGLLPLLLLGLVLVRRRKVGPAPG